MFFKDWRVCSQDLIDLPLQKNKFYYIQAQSWHLKGYLGGTHSYSTFFSSYHNKFLVVELSDFETTQYQNCNIIYQGPESTDKSKHCVFITDRAYNAQWFGNDPYIVDYCESIDYSDILYVAKKYPIDKFQLINQNCNTFTSYLHWQLNCNVHRPIRSVGYKTRTWWNKNYGT